MCQILKLYLRARRKFSQSIRHVSTGCLSGSNLIEVNYERMLLIFSLDKKENFPVCLWKCFISNYTCIKTQNKREHSIHMFLYKNITSIRTEMFWWTESWEHSKVSKSLNDGCFQSKTQEYPW